MYTHGDITSLLNLKLASIGFVVEVAMHWLGRLLENFQSFAGGIAMAATRLNL